jgi:Ca2+-binding EF-hand superfamily protein
MTLKNETMLGLFREVDVKKDGFLEVAEFQKIMEKICQRGVWESAYKSFLLDCKIDLPEDTQTKFWDHLNTKHAKTNPGLVPMDKMVAEIEKMIYSTGLLPSVLSTTVSLMGISVPESELRLLHELFDLGLPGAPGFMNYGDLYPLLNKLGRRGMPYSRFKAAVYAMGFRYSDRELYGVFAELDINQDNILDWQEFRGGVLVVVQERLPESILKTLGLSAMDVIQKVCFIVIGMGSLFAFLILALQSFGGGKAIIATIQSSFGSAITMAANGESSGGLDLEKYKSTVTLMVAGAMGLSAVPK